MILPKNKLLGPYTRPLILGITALHLIALVVKGDNTAELTALTLISIVTFMVAWRSLFAGMLIALTELFVGGHGHLISAQVFGFPLSLRISIFGAVMGVWLIQCIRKKFTYRFIFKRDIPWVILAGALMLGTLIGILKHNGFHDIFDDMNGYITIAYLLPIVSIVWDEKKKNIILQTLAASAIWISMITILFSFFFTHSTESIARPVYTFIRDTRLAEITLQSVSDSTGAINNPNAALILGAQSYFYRIFMQSQFFVAAIGIIIVSMMITQKEKITMSTSLLLILFSSTLILSSSRSFFLGIGVALCTILAAAMRVQKIPIQYLMTRTAYLMGLGILSMVLVWSTIIFPLPSRPDLSQALFYDTSVDITRTTAITSRWTLLPAMMNRIKQSPILGQGFGAKVSFITDDPRMRAETQNGVLQTYRFEWGYHDIWLKMGLLGLSAFGWYLLNYFQALKYTLRSDENRSLVIGLGASILMLYIIHVLSPYLNHPIGLMWMLFMIPFFTFTTKTQN